MSRKRVLVDEAEEEPSFIAPGLRVEKFLGRGAHGTVCSAIDENTGERFAVKKISGISRSVVLARRTLRELKLLRLLRHANIMSVKKVVASENWQDIWIVSEQMEMDLDTVVRSGQKISEEQCRVLMFQLLLGLYCLHAHGVLHRDLKPRNILVNRNCHLKICDFGLARCEMNGLPIGVTNMTDYVATRWYRAPEVITGSKHYTQAMDLWSVGCIFAELLARRPLFPGRDSTNQLELILKVLGTPSPSEISSIRRPDIREFVAALPPSPGIPLAHLFPEASPEALSLLSRLLSFDPDFRISAEEALADPYFSNLNSKFLYMKENGLKPALSFSAVSEFAFDFVPLNLNQLHLLFAMEFASHSKRASPSMSLSTPPPSPSPYRPSAFTFSSVPSRTSSSNSATTVLGSNSSASISNSNSNLNSRTATTTPTLPLQGICRRPNCPSCAQKLLVKTATTQTSTATNRPSLSAAHDLRHILRSESESPSCSSSAVAMTPAPMNPDLNSSLNSGLNLNLNSNSHVPSSLTPFLSSSNSRASVVSSNNPTPVPTFPSNLVPNFSASNSNSYSNLNSNSNVVPAALALKPSLVFCNPCGCFHVVERDVTHSAPLRRSVNPQRVQPRVQYLNQLLEGPRADGMARSAVGTAQSPLALASSSLLAQSQQSSMPVACTAQRVCRPVPVPSNVAPRSSKRLRCL